MLSFLTYIITVLIAIMMGTLYKHSFSNLAVLRFQEAKLKRIFWIIAFLTLLICTFLTYKSFISFNAKGEGFDKVNLVEDYQSMLVFFINVGFIILIVFSNIISFTTKQIEWLFYGVTFVAYAGFVVINNFYLENALFSFKRMHQLFTGGFSYYNLEGFLGLIITLGICLCNAYFTRWGLKK